MSAALKIHDAEPTTAEETIGLVEHANIDLEYARKQLQRANQGGTRSMMTDCINRAMHALDRVADAHGSIVVCAHGQTLEPSDPDVWTLEEIEADGRY